MKTTECATCERVFEVPAKKPKQKHCSRECWRQSRLKQVERTCETCNKPFSVQQGRSKARWCSWECRTIPAQLTCEYCGNTYYAKRSHAHLRRTCSRICARKLQASEKRAPHQDKPRSEETKQRVSDGLKRYYSGNPQKHWNFQNGPFAQRRGVHSSWQARRLEARTRDHFKCRSCGTDEISLGKQLTVHHIKAFRFFASADEANQPDNLLCVCQSCHMKLEHNKISLPI